MTVRTLFLDEPRRRVKPAAQTTTSNEPVDYTITPEDLNSFLLYRAIWKAFAGNPYQALAAMAGMSLAVAGTVLAVIVIG